MDICRNIVITGVAKGLGRALVEKFIQLGHRVAGCSRDPAAIQKLQELFPGDHHFSIVDVADDGRVEAWAGKVLKDFGTPDFVVNNAAVINRNAALWEVPEGEFCRVIDINIKGVANVIRHFVPAMIRQGRGVIVNFSSGWGRSVAPDVAPYCATKWAIEGLTKALAEELPAGMAAVPLNPGIINTDMLQSCFGAEAASHASPVQWAERAAPFILGLDVADNGRSLSIDS
jgi:NAD(P)-dependent dehydrogenase (short-subunit alcohol dehydrogenase family)